MQAAFQSFSRKDSTLASGIREYQPGDRFAWVDWKTSARRMTS
nr:DUF58 domain-containing protein [Bacillus licheniformis]